WPKQARMLADYLVSDLGAKNEKNGMVRTDTPTHEDTHDAFVQAMSRRGAPLDYDRTVPNTEGSSQAQVVIQELKAMEIRNVHVLTRPVFFLQMLDAARTHDYHPLWTGVGITMTITDTVADVGCRNGPLGGAKFLSPLPAFAGRDRFDRRHDRAMQTVFGRRGDAITWLGWATGRATAKMLRRAGRDLTRRRFVGVAEQTGRFRTRILPGFDLSARDHFGGRAIHVLEARCRDRRWHTVRRFVRDF
ncbi:MAG: ABC transporter substrate-binding protein, partial [Actinomycetota bacterium]|nr:ABC transporter substrate-binding protein [Actinomycetota bacterium]